jgi:hypothetical protein
MGRLIEAYARESNPVLRASTLREMLRPQPATAGTWGLGHEVFVANAAGGHVVGHSGGSPPAWGAMLRVNPATGNGMALLVSGGRGATNRLPHDWVWWETGHVTAESRLQVVQDRAVPAAVAIVIGWAAIVLLRSWRARASA